MQETVDNKSAFAKTGALPDSTSFSQAEIERQFTALASASGGNYRAPAKAGRRTGVRDSAKKKPLGEEEPGARDATGSDGQAQAPEQTDAAQYFQEKGSVAMHRETSLRDGMQLALADGASEPGVLSDVDTSVLGVSDASAATVPSADATAGASTTDGWPGSVGVLAAGAGAVVAGGGGGGGGSQGSGAAVAGPAPARYIAAPTVVLASDTGLDATDKITRSAGLTVSGTESGATVQFSLDGGTTWGTSYTTPTLDNIYTVAVRQIDAAGNTSAASNLTFTLDTASPTTTISTASLSADTGSSSTDWITNTATQTVTATLSTALATGSGAVSVERLYASTDGGGTWADITGLVSGTAVAWTGFALPGVGALELQVRDLAGNTGTAYSHVYVLDTASPTTTISTASLSADTGSSSSDWITNTASQTVTATLSAALATGSGAVSAEHLWGSVDGGGSWADITGMVSGTTVAWTGVTLAGANTLELQVRDLAGNTGTAYTHVFTLDTQAPSAPTLALSTDTGNTTDKITQNAGLTVTGSETGATVQYSVDGGTWGTTYTAPTASTNSTGDIHTVSVRQIDAATNTSAPASLVFTLDTQAPSAPTLALSTDTGNTTDKITQNAGLTVTGSETGATVQYSVDGGSTWGTSYTAPTAGTGGTADVHTVSVRQFDAAGNTSTASDLVFTLDNTPPNASLTAATFAIDTSNAIVQSSETGTAYLVSTGVSGITTVSDITSAADSAWNSVSIGTANANTNLALTGLGNGTYKLYTADAAGNLSSASSNSVVLSVPIDLGTYGKLIAPVTVDGKTYYYWDYSGDGTTGGVDYMTHNTLDTIFNGGSDTTNSTRSAVINGVSVMLPTHGEATMVTGDRPGTAVTGSGDNPTYNDLLAIWDAYNGTGTGTGTSGVPPGWQANGYWSATPSASGHAGVYLSDGSVGAYNDGLNGYVALQVL